MAKILYFITEDWYFVSHRLPLALAAKEAGHEVALITNVNSHGEFIEGKGIRLLPINLSRRSFNLFRELAVIRKLISIYRTEKPDIVHHVALKPVIYGTFAARLNKVKGLVNALAGLGSLFSSDSLKIRIARPLIIAAFKLFLNCRQCVLILQNPDDMALLAKGNVVRPENMVLIRGSGVDTDQYRYLAEPSGVPVVLMASRLLWEKGVGEFVEAAEILRNRGVEAKFILFGRSDHDNPSAIAEDQLFSWNRDGKVEWRGHSGNMPEVIAGSHIVCLPSYYGEGVPRVLIEAASCGRPIVTADMPGCREIVLNKENGLLVPPRDAAALADAVEKLIGSAELREKFGKRGREHVVSNFSISRVVNDTLELYRKVAL